MYKESQLYKLKEILDLKLKGAEKQLEPLVEKSLKSKGKYLKRKAIITKLKNIDIYTKWEQLAAYESKLKEYFSVSNENEKMTQDSIGQLSFQNEHFKSLNQIPFVLLGLSVFKIWVVPVMAVFMPLFAFFAPFLVIRFVYNIRMSFDQYLHMMKEMWMGTGQPTIRSYTQIGLFLFSTIQGIIQPVQNAIHYNTTDTVIKDIGNTLIELRKSIEELRALFKEQNIPFHFTTVLQDLDISDSRRSFFFLNENQGILEEIFVNLGELEILWKISSHSHFKPVSFLKPAETPYLFIEGLQDITIHEIERVKSNVFINENTNHSIVTGPNGGGKSSSMRAILQTVLLAQTFGYSCVTQCILRPFQWIAPGLSLQEAPGKKSMFETEVAFAVNILKKKGLGLILFDELFHSTNPPDAIRTADVFLKRLWTQRNIASFISTHVFELVDKAPESIQRLCVFAERKEDKLIYHYKLQKGICKESSVDEILVREGLLKKTA